MSQGIVLLTVRPKQEESRVHEIVDSIPSIPEVEADKMY